MDPMERSWGIPDLVAGENIADEAERARLRKSLYDLMGQYFVCCWHLNIDESAAMWNVYGQRGEGVAIRTSLRRLCDAFSHQDSMDALHWRIVPLQVNYIDHSIEGVGEENALNLLRSKSKSYEYENEVRFALFTPVNVSALEVDGAYVPVTLPEAIEAVFVSPRAPRWFREIISAVSELYGLPGDCVHQSSLDEGPLY